MKTIAKIFLLGLFIQIVLISSGSASDIGLVSERHTIDITTSQTGLLVEEKILLNNTSPHKVTTIRFWIQQHIKDVEIQVVESGYIINPIISGNTREVNLSTTNYTIEPGDKLEILLSYTLATNTQTFEKRTFYDVSILTVNFNKEELYKGETLQSDSYLKIHLFKPTEAPLSITFLVIIFVIVVILITTILMLLRKQRTRVKRSIVESEEILNTKKTLMMSVLKDIEKQHRSKSISDDTYNKLKDEYKQQAVEAMKKLEELK